MSREIDGLLKIAQEQGYEVRAFGSHRRLYRDGVPVCAPGRNNPIVIQAKARNVHVARTLEVTLRRAGVRFPWRAQRERGDEQKQEEQTMVTIETQNGSAHQTEEVRPHRAPLGPRTATVDGTATGPVTPDAEVAALLGEGAAIATEQPRVRTLKVCARCRREDEAAGDPRQGRRPLRAFGPNRSTKDGLAYYCQKHAREMALEVRERQHGRRQEPSAVAEQAAVAVVEATPEPVAASDSAVAPSLDGADLFEMMAALERRMGDMESRLMPGILRRLTALEEIPPAPVPVAPPAPAAPPDALRAAGLAARLMEHMHDVCLLAENAARLHMLVTGGGLLREEAALLTQHGTAALARQLYTEGPDTTTDNDESTEV